MAASSLAGSYPIPPVAPVTKAVAGVVAGRSKLVSPVYSTINPLPRDRGPRRRPRRYATTVNTRGTPNRPALAPDQERGAGWFGYGGWDQPWVTE